MGTCMPEPPQKNQVFPMTEHTKIRNTPNTFVSQFKGELVNNSYLEGSAEFFNLVSKNKLT